MNTKQSTQRARPGRKPNTLQLDSMLEAAVEEFVVKGFEGANLRSILANSGASAGSLYRRFGSKEGLFRKVVERHADLSYPRNFKLQPSGRPIAAELAEFAHAYLSEFLQPQVLSFARMIYAEADNFPELCQRIWELGPSNAARQVAEYLRHYADLKLLDVEDTDLAAAQFLDMIKCGFHVRQILTGNPPSLRELTVSVRQGVAIFCKGIAAQPTVAAQAAIARYD